MSGRDKFSITRLLHYAGRWFVGTAENAINQARHSAFSTIARGQVSLALLELRAYRSKYEADTSSLRQMQKDSGSKTVAQRKRALVGAE
jgi:hypothetical protein